MPKHPDLQMCRDNILTEANSNQVASARLGLAFITVQGIDATSLTLKGYLTRRRGESKRTDSGISRVAKLRSSLGCVGMRADGVCCLAECIPLQGARIPQPRRKPSQTNLPMPQAPVESIDAVSETVELITA